MVSTPASQHKAAPLSRHGSSRAIQEPLTPNPQQHWGHPSVPLRHLRLLIYEELLNGLEGTVQTPMPILLELKVTSSSRPTECAQTSRIHSPSLEIDWFACYVAETLRYYQGLLFVDPDLTR